MMIYLKLVDYNAWEAVLYGSHIPTTIIDGRTVEKPPKDQDENDKKKNPYMLKQ